MLPQLFLWPLRSARWHTLAPPDARQTLHRILSETTAVTPGMALRLGRFCGNGPNLWIRMQEAYDLWQAEQALGAELARIKPAKVA